jgi:hypothetical protein
MRRSVCHRRAKPIYWTVSRRSVIGNSKGGYENIKRASTQKALAH